MQSAFLVFPHQLYKHLPVSPGNAHIFLIEYSLFFTQYSFHKQKLLLHRASMKYYEEYLTQKEYEVSYVEHHKSEANLDVLFAVFAQQGITNVQCTEVIDYLLERRLLRYSTKHQIKLRYHTSPNFIRTKQDNEHYFADKRLFLTDYYVHLRKELGIMLEAGKPMGGKWTYDTDNRKKMPAGTYVPPLPQTRDNKYVHEARAYIAKYFDSNYGTTENFLYPITHTEAEDWLNNFLQQRFTHYGVYQDAIVRDSNWLFHSILTPMLNIGLLSPDDVIAKAIAYAVEHHIPINSLEGFVRQVLGWREYIRAVYEAKGVQQRTTNQWQHNRKIPASFWQGNTGILPLDNAIKRVLNSAYNHHIERLMLLGNFMFLCGFDPDEVYRWFMEMYIDSYDWVMVPNVYGMSQYADGGLMSTNPYISGSSYILKMSNYPKGEWCTVWDALYWRFIHEHKAEFVRNPRMSMMAVQVSKMDNQKLSNHLKTAEDFLNKL